MMTIDRREMGPGSTVLATVLVTAALFATGSARAELVGGEIPESFSLCESPGDANENPRPQCQASDIRFEAGAVGATDFGFAVATGHLNDDDRVDLVVGDPDRNRVYVFFGRASVTSAYDLDPTDPFDRGVSADEQADVILERALGGPNPVGSFGFSVAVGRERIEGSCGENGAAALAIGAPGTPGDPDAPGRVFYVPAGALCRDVQDPPTPEVLDPVDLGEVVTNPVVDNDEFGYSVAFGRLLTTSGTDEDLIVGARAAVGGNGSVTAFPVTDGDVAEVIDGVVRIEGDEGDALGEALAIGDLDQDFDEDLEPQGDRDDLAIGGVGAGGGKVVIVRGPLSPAGGQDRDGVFRAEFDTQLKTVVGERDGDYFGFSVAISGEGRLLVGAVYADNTPPTGAAGGPDPLTNVDSGERIRCGKVYAWAFGLFDQGAAEILANSADNVLVGRRSGDHLGMAVGFANFDGVGADDLVVTARREDGRALSVDDIDQGTAYLAYDRTTLGSPVDLNQCAASSDCTGVGEIDVLVFGSDRVDDLGDEIGFALATGDWNGDGSDDLFLSSRTRNHVYAVTVDDADDDRDVEGRNIRDDDDDNDGDPDSTDCFPRDEVLNSQAEEIPCNQRDENCNGDADDVPDDDGDGFDACGADGALPDCDDDDPATYPGAPEACDGNDNACAGSIPQNERDLDEDLYVRCEGWDDTQGDDPEVLAGGDCDPFDPSTHPSAADADDPPEACRTDVDDDGYGDVSPRDGVTPGTDCNDVAARTFPGAAENDDPEACMADEDEDGWGDADAPSPVVPGQDCDDDDRRSFPGATERCDGNDNACAGAVADTEIDGDADGYVACAPWSDPQGDDPAVLAGGDCDATDPTTFPGAAPNEVDPGACHRDEDGDDWGDLDPPAGVPAGSDCDDGSVETFPGAAEIEAPLNCMRDADDDGYGDESAVLPVVAGTDCDDEDDTRFRDAEEVPDDGIDQDCDGVDAVTCFVDDDGDGFGGPESLVALDGNCDDPGESAVDTDCDDTDPDVSPDATEIPGDGIDQDCDGSDAATCFVDADGDGFGNAAGDTVLAPDGTCDAEDNESDTADDCDDADPATYPGAPERCDGADNACAGSVPADEADGDGDGYVVCTDWVGDDPAIVGGGDCDDDGPATFPGSAENESVPGVCRRDSDGDGYGDVAPPPGVSPGTDCDDLSRATFPGAAPNDGPLNCMRDVDDDDFGDPNVRLPVVKGTDCDDLDAATYPGAPEACDGNDNACAGAVSPDEIDGDGDLWVTCAGWADTQGDDPGILGGGDCDPADPRTFPGVASSESFVGACMTDADGDTWGDISPAAGVTPGTDCDDDSAVTFPGAADVEAPFNCMRDADDDGYGDATAVLPVVAGTDCDDSTPAASPGEIEGPEGDATCADTLDNDCDGATDAADPGCGPPVPCPDADDDGFADCTTEPTCDATGLTCGDCDDASFDVNPDGTESCNQVDDDCDGSTDEDFDADGDLFSTCATPTPDCDDTDPGVNPGADEVCGDAVDNDCDPATPDLFDGDGDGAACDVDCDDADAGLNLDDVDGDTVTTCAGDCDDQNPTAYPGADELCNDGADNDCDPSTPDVFDGDEDGASCIVDCDDADAGLNLDDADGDTYSSCAGDCDDADAAINPDASEVCDGADNDCDGFVDESFDDDGDGFSTCATPVPDCDDGNPDINPGEPEVCNDGVDNDCSAATPDLFDGDGDGATCADDCNDADPTTFPGAIERCDGNDNDCNSTVPADETDPDSDGWVECAPWDDVQGDDPAIAGGGDCDPSDAATFPGAAPAETNSTACMRDADLDGYGDQFALAPVTPGTDCDDTSAETFVGAAQVEAPFNCMRDVDDDGWGDDTAEIPVVKGTDCDDLEAGVNPAATEIPGDGIDQDCDGSDAPALTGGVDRRTRTTDRFGTRARDVSIRSGDARDLRLRLSRDDTLEWDAAAGRGGSYTVVRGDLGALRSSEPSATRGSDAPSSARFEVGARTRFEDAHRPPPGEAVFYLIEFEAGARPARGRTEVSPGTGSATPDNPRLPSRPSRLRRPGGGS